MKWLIPPHAEASRTACPPRWWRASFLSTLLSAAATMASSKTVSNAIKAW